MTEKGLYEIYNTWHIPFWKTTWFYVAISSFSGLIFLCGIYLVIKKIRSRPKKKLPFWQQALHDIEQLRQNMNVAAGKEFYLQLTTILKRYIAQRYYIDVRGKTDDELINYLSNHPLFDDTLLYDISSIFTGSVTIKFAHVQAAQEQMENDYRKAVEFVKATQIQESKN